MNITDGEIMNLLAFYAKINSTVDSYFILVKINKFPRDWNSFTTVPNSTTKNTEC